MRLHHNEPNLYSTRTARRTPGVRPSPWSTWNLIPSLKVMLHRIRHVILERGDVLDYRLNIRVCVITFLGPQCYIEPVQRSTTKQQSESNALQAGKPTKRTCPYQAQHEQCIGERVRVLETSRSAGSTRTEARASADHTRQGWRRQHRRDRNEWRRTELTRTATVLHWKAAYAIRLESLATLEASPTAALRFVEMRQRRARLRPAELLKLDATDIELGLESD